MSFSSVRELLRRAEVNIDSNIESRLVNNDAWRDSETDCKLIVEDEGSRLVPDILAEIKGLDPGSVYCVALDFQRTFKNRELKRINLSDEDEEALSVRTLGVTADSPCQGENFMPEISFKDLIIFLEVPEAKTLRHYEVVLLSLKQYLPTLQVYKFVDAIQNYQLAHERELTSCEIIPVSPNYEQGPLTRMQSIRKRRSTASRKQRKGSKVVEQEDSDISHENLSSEESLNQSLSNFRGSDERVLSSHRSSFTDVLHAGKEVEFSTVLSTSSVTYQSYSETSNVSALENTIHAQGLPKTTGAGEDYGAVGGFVEPNLPSLGKSVEVPVRMSNPSTRSGPSNPIYIASGSSYSRHNKSSDNVFYSSTPNPIGMPPSSSTYSSSSQVAQGSLFSNVPHQNILESQVEPIDFLLNLNLDQSRNVGVSLDNTQSGQSSRAYAIDPIGLQVNPETRYESSSLQPTGCQGEPSNVGIVNQQENLNLGLNPADTFQDVDPIPTEGNNIDLDCFGDLPNFDFVNSMEEAMNWIDNP